ncbi:MAG TPA: hypothetical protein VJZ25_07045 [Gemmatimonadaceae bacterium]|nr:hypothetical protein [Gemmatimonadaceae bacterium]
MRNTLKWAAIFLIALALTVALGAPPLNLGLDSFPLIIGATVGGTVMTMADWAKTLDPNGRPARIIEMLTQKNELLDDAMFMEGNLEIGHRTTIRTGLPTAYWRLLNVGTPPSKDTTAQVTESCGILEALSKIDVEVANLGGNPASVRLSKSRAFVEAMSQEMAQTLFYGNVTSAPEEFNGLSVRYSSLSAANGKNIVAGGGAGDDNSSIWLICWGPEKVTGIFPKGSTAGVQHKDYGEQLIADATGIAGAVLPAFVDLWQWKCGLVVEDWRYAVRICNIDISALVAESSDANLTKLMTKAIHRLQDTGGKVAFYANRTIVEFLDIQRQERVQTGGQLGYGVVDGKNTLTFRGIPIRTCDALLETEATVS